MADARVDEKTGRYLPIIHEIEKPFWEATKTGRLILQKCSDCGHVRYPIGPMCPQCQSTDSIWEEMSGEGVVHNYVVYHKGWTDYLKTKVPYAVVQVELVEGPRLTTNILGVPVSEVHIGMPVHVAFEEVTDAITLVQFSAKTQEANP